MKLLKENNGTRVYEKKEGVLIIHQGKPTDTRDTIVGNLSEMYPENGRYLLYRVNKKEGTFNSQWTGFIPNYNLPSMT